MKQQGAKRLIETARKNLEKFLEIIIFCEKNLEKFSQKIMIWFGK